MSEAKKPRTRFLGGLAAVGGVMFGVGFGLFGNPEMFWFWASVVFVSLVVVAVGLLYEYRDSKIAIGVVVAGSVITIVLYLAFIVFPTASLTIRASVHSPAYEAGSLVGKVRWSKDFARLLVDVTNDSEHDYSDIDISVTVPGVFIVDVSQESKIDCPMIGLQVPHQFFTVREEKPGGEVIDKRLEANSGTVPFRVRCHSLPRLMSIELAITILRGEWRRPLMTT